MAFTVLAPGFTQQVTRGKTANLGTLAAANQAVQFTIANLREPPNGTDALTIQVPAAGALVGGTFVLEVSLDNGLSWGTVLASANSAGANNSTAIVSTTGVADTAATFISTYNVTGLSGPGLFRFGTTALTSGTGAVLVCCP